MQWGWQDPAHQLCLFMIYEIFCWHINTRRKSPLLPKTQGTTHLQVLNFPWGSCPGADSWNAQKPAFLARYLPILRHHTWRTTQTTTETEGITSECPSSLGNPPIAGTALPMRVNPYSLKGKTRPKRKETEMNPDLLKITAESIWELLPILKLCLKKSQPRTTE